MPVLASGWFDGLVRERVEEAAADCLRHAQGFVLEPWGLVGVREGDRRWLRRLELGDRAVDDAASENGDDPVDRLDWVIAKAQRTQPLGFVEFLAQAG